MAVSGFEGFEKRLEIHFSGDDPVASEATILGLRLLDFPTVESILRAVQCTVVSAVGNRFFDAYVLSESSLFVYPTKIIIKTCGTTQLLKSIRPLLHHAQVLGLHVSGLKYTRGSFIFPGSQPYPHTSFKDEVRFIENCLPNDLYNRKALVMLSKLPSHAWHVFTAGTYCTQNDDGLYTIEVCMTELDPVMARKFYRRPADNNSGDVAGKEMTEATGISGINPNFFICDFAFDPCGYSMNGMDGEKYSTIHVTPEDGYSYASFECVGCMYDDENDVVEVLKRVVQVFRPGVMTVATTRAEPGVWARIASGLEPMGLKCRSCSADDFPAVGTVLYQTFTSRRK